MATTYEELEARVATLERLVRELKLEKLAKVLAGSGSKKSASSTRRVREYTDEERAAIRARLLAGQEAARKRREAEAGQRVRVFHVDPVSAARCQHAGVFVRVAAPVAAIDGGPGHLREVVLIRHHL